MTSDHFGTGFIQRLSLIILRTFHMHFHSPNSIYPLSRSMDILNRLRPAGSVTPELVPMLTRLDTRIRRSLYAEVEELVGSFNYSTVYIPIPNTGV